jgi:hypothetical protein
MASKVKYTPTESGNVELGQAGSQYIAASQTAVLPSNGDFVKIHVFSSGPLTTVGAEAAFPSLSAVTVPAGTILYGRFTSITTGAGITLVAYNG